ncbi:MAG: DNA translocase FtsK 4TM domain-containing protein [Planctomycetes bacterium]|nr:DNA translocase FtsK 4TM domain-containing protein [Planctomycetota bacterium]
MAHRRSARLDLVALGLFVAGLVVAVAVFSHLPGALSADQNLLGPIGDQLAGAVERALGSTVYLVLAIWFLLVILLFLRKSWFTWSRRVAGWLLLLPCAAIAAHISADSLGRDFFGGQRLLSGGALGAWLNSSMEESLTTLGKITFGGGAFVLGLVLALDFLVIACLRAVGNIVAGLGHAIATYWARYRKWRRSPVAAKPRRKPNNLGDIPIRHPAATASEPLDARPAEPGPVLLPIIRTPHTQAEEEPTFDDYELPPISLLEDPEPFPYQLHEQRLRDTAALLEQTFKDFELNVRVVGINTGPVITQYEIALETGMRLNKVTALADDLALNLRVPSVRVVAPLPGKNTVGIEVPNEHRAVVNLKEVMLAAGKKISKCKVPLFLGKDTEGRSLVYDLAEMPHLLIAGRTGTGKSVCLNAIIISILMTRRPDETKLIMIDPKKTELSEYGKIPHLMHPVVKDEKKAEAILAWAVDKMEERYDLLSRARVRNIAGYNELSLEELHRRVQPDEDEIKQIPEKMPYIVIVVDEVGDLIMMMKREVETHIIRLAQKSRAAGIHLVLATQKPTVDIITGLIKSNLPARICFQVSSRSDSRVVLDEMGAEKLLGKGDLLFLQPGTSTIIRAQGTYASDNEISKVVGHLECDKPCYAAELIQLKASSEDGQGLDNLKERDPLYEQAIEIVVREGRGSVSLLQRALGIGYGRAARLIDFMAEDGIVGAYNGSNAREVLFTPEEWQQMKGGAEAARA